MAHISIEAGRRVLIIGCKAYKFATAVSSRAEQCVGGYTAPSVMTQVGHSFKPFALGRLNLRISLLTSGRDFIELSGVATFKVATLTSRVPKFTFTTMMAVL